MKTVTSFLATLCLPLLLVSQCPDGWQVSKIFDTTRFDSTWNFFSVHFPDNETGWIAGTDGNKFLQQSKVYHSKDNGISWQANPDTGDFIFNVGWLSDIFFLKRNRGWVVGYNDARIPNGTIYHTQNGGKTWNSQLSKDTAEKYKVGFLQSIHFIDSNTGWTVGNGSILHTKNGGKRWIQQTDPLKEGFYNAVYFVNKQNGWIASGGANKQGHILKTKNGGDKWKVVKKVKTNKNIDDIHFANHRYGWAVGDSGLLLHSNDGGKNWQTQQSGVQDFLYAVYAIDTNRVWAVGSSGTILRTYNGGKSWHKHEVNTGQTINDLQFVNATTGRAVGSDGLYMRYQKSLPHATFAYDKTGAAVNFYNTSLNDSLFRWHFGDGATSQQSNPKHLYDSNGTYQACLIAENACGADTFCREVTVKSTGIKPGKSGKWQLQVFPNPVQEKVTFQYRLPTPQGVTLTLTSTNGKVVKRINLGKQQAGQHEQRINMSSLKAGIYYYKLQGSEHEQAGKLVKIEE